MTKRTFRPGFHKYIDFMKDKHAGQFRKGWERPYYYHPLEVASLLIINGESPNTVIAGYFHDLLEDTDATKEEILAISNEEVLELVELMTKDKSKPDQEYVDKVMSHPESKKLKLADRIVNLQDVKFANKKLRKRYSEDTVKYYLPHARGTKYEALFISRLNDLRQMVELESEEH